MSLRRLLLVCLLASPCAFGQLVIGNFSGEVEARTEGLYWLTDPTYSHAIQVYVDVAYRGGEFESRQMPDGQWRLIPTKPPVVAPDSYLAYRARWILDENGWMDISKNRAGLLVQKVVGIAATTLGTAYVVQGDGYDVLPGPADKRSPQAFLDGASSAYGYFDATVHNADGTSERAFQTTTRFPLRGIADSAQRICIVASRNARGLPLLISTASFSGAQGQKLMAVPSIRVSHSRTNTDEKR